MSPPKIPGFFLLITTLCLVVPALSQSSQTTGGEQTTDMVLKKTVRRVIVDVVVSDATNKPVSGLTVKDFVVKEDKVTQNVLTFDIHSLDAGVDSIPTLPQLPPNTFLNVPARPEKGPLFVILYDMVNMEVEDQLVARQQILKFIRAKPAGTRFAIFVASDALRLVQGFTEDENQLYATLDPSTPARHVPKVFLNGRNHGMGDPFYSISVLTNIAHYLEGLPGHKNLIWFSSRFPVRMFPQEGDSPDMREDTLEVISALTRSQTAVYTVDAGGVNPENAHGPGPQTEMGRIDIANGGSGGGAVDQGAGASLIMTNQMAERDIAHQTGGKAFVGTNDIKGAFDEAAEMGGNYYSISYSPSNQNYDGSLRKIEVELAKRGYQLSYRRSYYADDPGLPSPHIKKTSLSDDTARRPGDSLAANMQRGAPLVHQLLFKAHVYTASGPQLGTPEQMMNLAEQPAYFRERRKDKPAKPLAPIQLQSYNIDYTVMVRQIKSASANNRPNLEIAAAAYDADGKMVNGVVEKAVEIFASNPFGSLQTAPPPEWEPSQKGLYRAQQHIDIPLGATVIRLAVRDLDSDRIGAMEIPLPLAAEGPAANGPAITTIPTSPNP